MSVIIEVTPGLYTRAQQFAETIEIMAVTEAPDAVQVIAAAQRRLDAAALRFSAAQARRTGEAHCEAFAASLEAMADLLEAPACVR